MRVALIAAAVLLMGPALMARGETAPYHAGIVRMTVSATSPFDALVWYPTRLDETPWRAGPFPVPASHDAEVASGRFPVVLLSHGGGPTGGSPLVLRALSAGLARRGFLVVAPFHGKTNLPRRRVQALLALDAIMADARFSEHADPALIGALGYSLGGAVVLELAGAVPDMAHLEAYCGAHPDDVMSCRRAPGGDAAAPQGTSAAERSPPARTLKAMVLLDPFAALFPRESLTAVTMPTLVSRPDQSELPGEANAVGLAAALPRPPRYETVPGGHFIFVDVCEPFLKSAAPETCADPPGVDRDAVHADIETKIAEFFHDHLQDH